MCTRKNSLGLSLSISAEFLGLDSPAIVGLLHFCIIIELPLQSSDQIERARALLFFRLISRRFWLNRSLRCIVCGAFDCARGRALD